MLPIPFLFNLHLAGGQSLLCNSGTAYPGGVATASIWFKAGPTASTQTEGFNVVNSTQWTEWNDFGTRGVDLTQTISSNHYEYSSAFEQNGIRFFGTSDVTAHFQYQYTGQTSIPATAAKGTLIVVWRMPTSGGASITWFMKPGDSTLSKGYIFRGSSVTILGDNQNYEFNNYNGIGQFNITIVSVSSAGTPVAYRNNGVTGTTASYSTSGVNAGSTWITSFDTNNGVSLCEFMWFQNNLSDSDCTKIENYLKEKWCISY